MKKALKKVVGKAAVGATKKACVRASTGIYGQAKEPQCVREIFGK